MRAKVLGVAVLAGLALGSANAATVVKIATLSPLSGPVANIGEQINLGTKLAVEAKKKMFLDKYGIELQVSSNDDQATASVGVAASKKIATDKRVLAIVGTLNSSVVTPVSEAVKSYNLAIVSPANTATTVTDRGLPNMNRICARDDAQGAAGADYMVKNLKVKTVYVVHDKTTYGEGLATEVKKGLEAQGVRVVFEGTDEKSNFAPLVTKVQAINPDAVYYGGLASTGGALFVKQLRDSGVKATYMGGDGLDDSELQKQAGDAAKGVLFTTAAASVDVVPAAKALEANFKKTFNKEMLGYGLMSYDAANVVLAGIEKAIKDNKLKKGVAPTRAQVMKAIRGVKVNTLSGTVEFNSVGDRKAGYLYVTKVQDDLSTKVIDSVAVKAPKK